MIEIEYTVVGAGVVGLAVTRALAESGKDVALIEREISFGYGTSSRNSEVIHSGIYYPKDTLKKQMCIQGKTTLYQYAVEKGIPHKRCGKLIVANSSAQKNILKALLKNGRENGLMDLEWLDASTAEGLEASLRCTHGAIWSPSTGIIDSHALMSALEADALAAGALVAYRNVLSRVEKIAGGFDISVLTDSGQHTFKTKGLVNCAGLFAWDVAEMIGAPDIPPRYYAKGNYMRYDDPGCFERLIYPVPEPGGLGIHSTINMAGEIRFGPNVSWVDKPDYGVDEGLEGVFLPAIRSYFPDINPSRLSPDFAGVRPKTVPRGAPNADFQIIQQDPRVVHLFGIESPGLTSSLALAEYITEMLT